MKHRAAIVLSAAFVVIGCADAIVTSDSNCDTRTVAWSLPDLPTFPQSVTVEFDASQFEGTGVTLSDAGTPEVDLPPISSTVTFDFSRLLSKLSDVSNNIQVSIHNLEVTNVDDSLDWVSNIEVHIKGATTSTPDAELGHTSFNNLVQGSPLVVNVTMNVNRAFTYLASGPVTLTVTISSNVLTLAQVRSLVNLGGTLSSTMTMCVPAQGKFSKSIL